MESLLLKVKLNKVVIYLQRILTDNPQQRIKRVVTADLPNKKVSVDLTIFPILSKKVTGNSAMLTI